MIERRFRVQRGILAAHYDGNGPKRSSAFGPWAEFSASQGMLRAVTHFEVISCGEWAADDGMP